MTITHAVAEGAREGDLGSAMGFPSQSEAAKMLKVKESTLSRSRAEFMKAGRRGRRYRPRTVLELGLEYRRRSLNEIAGDLLHYARMHEPAREDDVREEIESFFSERTTPPLDPERFLEEAKRTLPNRLFQQVKRAYEEGPEPGQIDFVGVSLEDRSRSPAVRGAH